VRVVFSDRSDKAVLFAGLASHLRDSKCASDRDGVWSPHEKAEKAATVWAKRNDLQISVAPNAEGTRTFHVV